MFELQNGIFELLGVGGRAGQLLIEGQAQKITNWVDPKDTSGEFKRGASVFRNFISREKGAEFPAEKGRYHLFVSYACPWGVFSLLCLSNFAITDNVEQRTAR